MSCATAHWSTLFAIGLRRECGNTIPGTALWISTNNSLPRWPVCQSLRTMRPVSKKPTRRIKYSHSNKILNYVSLGPKIETLTSRSRDSQKPEIGTDTHGLISKSVFICFILLNQRPIFLLVSRVLRTSQQAECLRFQGAIPGAFVQE